jgi:integrase
MARKGRQDRGFIQRTNAQGKLVWYVRLHHQAKERRFGSFPTKTKARECYEKAKTEQKEGRFFPERYQHGGYSTVESVIDTYLKTATNKKAYEDEKFFGRWWKAWFKDQRLNAITPQRIEEARRQLLKEKKSPARINRYQAWLRHVLNVAIRDGKLTTNPAAKVKMLRESKGCIRFLSVEEEAKLLGQMGPVYSPYARFAILTGLRQAEQFRLEWAHVDLERGFLTLPMTKAGEVQYVPLNKEAKEILRGLDSWQRSRWVFPSKNPASPINPRHLMWLYRASVIAAGIEWVSWHALRHTFASRLAMQGVPLTTIAALLRHSTTSLVKRYAHLSPTYLKSAIEEVSIFGRVVSEQEVTDTTKVETAPSKNGTVTETGKGERLEEVNRA